MKEADIIIRKMEGSEMLDGEQDNSVKNMTEVKKRNSRSSEKEVKKRMHDRKREGGGRVDEDK